MHSNLALRRFLINLYGYAFFGATVFLYPVYALFFADHGISDAGISALFIIWSLETMLAQIPVGIIANKVSPKGMVVFGSALKISCFIMWIIWPTFWGFVLGFMLWGIECAIYTAISESLIYEELKRLRHRRIYLKICGRKSAVQTIGYMVSSAGSAMMILGYDFVTWVSIASIIISMLFFIRIEGAGIRPKNARAKVIKALRMGMDIIKKSPYVLNLMILVAALGATSYLDDFLGLIGNDAGVPIEYIGILFVMTSVFNGIGQAMAHKFEYAKNTNLYLGIVGMGALFILMSMLWSVPAMAIFGLFYLVLGIVKTLVYVQFQHAISSNCRTILLSVFSLFEQAACIITYIAIGTGAELGGYRVSVLLLGTVIVVLGVWAMMFIPGKTIKIKAGKCVVRTGACSVSE